QDDHQVEKRGEDKASWYVGWYEPGGRRRCKSCGPGEAGKRNAQKRRRKLEAHLMTDTYRSQTNKTWPEFRAELDAKVLSLSTPETRRLTLNALDHFARLAKPLKVYYVATPAIDDYVAARSREKGQKPGSTVSAATVNKELRHLRAALKFALDWGYLPQMPRFRFLKETQHLATYVTGDHFALLYAACEKARLPRGLPYPAAEWWRGVLVVGYMTGWRIGEII